MGEQHVRALLKRYFIARTSWLYGPNGKNFVTTILKVAHQQKVLRVVDDQHGSPTYTRHLSLKIAELAETQAYGVYHTTGSGTCSWFEFARTILDLWPVEGVQVLPITSDEFGRAARRPANSVLENRALRQAHMELMPHWKVALTEYLDEIKESGQAREFEESKHGIGESRLIGKRQGRRLVIVPHPKPEIDDVIVDPGVSGTSQSLEKTNRKFLLVSLKFKGHNPQAQ